MRNAEVTVASRNFIHSIVAMNTICPGCGLRLPAIDGPRHLYMTASASCWATYGRVLAREYSDPSLLSTHRLSVDTYAVQHPGGTDRQSIQSVGLHLARLYLTIDRDLPPDYVNRIAVQLATRKREFLWLKPPGDRGELTVADVEQATDARAHIEQVGRWARTVFQAWREHHDQVARWVKGIEHI